MVNYRPPVSLEICRRLAAEQGLTVHQLPREKGRRRRYAISRGDTPVTSEIARYDSLRVVCEALTAPNPKPRKTAGAQWAEMSLRNVKHT